MMTRYKDLRCPDCSSYKYCKGKVTKGSSECDNRRGLRSKKKTKRFNYMKELIRR